MTNVNLKHVQQLAQRQMSLEDALDAAEKEVKKIKADLVIVAEKEIPEVLDRAEIETITLSDGSVISIKTSYQAHISEEHRKKAFAWLRKKNLDGLIKHDVTVPFAKGEEKKAQTFLKWIRGKMPDHEITDKEAVHAQTLKAFVREQIENGKNIPMDLFGVHKVVRATIKRSAH